jgi:hypothetical protein
VLVARNVKHLVTDGKGLYIPIYEKRTKTIAPSVPPNHGFHGKVGVKGDMLLGLIVSHRSHRISAVSSSRV